jgi:Fe-S-cluster containining protein
VPVDRRVQAAIHAYQQQAIIPHCVRCSRPCCALTDVVLDLSWQEAKTLYRIGSSKRTFDEGLQRGEPAHIRKQDGRYFAHAAPCPAYREDKRCGVYDTAAKPAGCSDFPVYVDGDVVVADRRCEALNPDALQQLLRHHGVITQQQPGAFAEFVELVVVRS